MRVTPLVHGRFVEELKRYKRRKKLSISSLSKELHFSRPTVSRWLNPRKLHRPLNADTVHRVSRELHLNSSFIFGWTDATNTVFDIWPLRKFQEQAADALSCQALPIARAAMDYALIGVFHQLQLFGIKPRLVFSNTGEGAIYVDFPQALLTFVFEMQLASAIRYTFRSVRDSQSAILHQGDACEEAILDIARFLKATQTQLRKFEMLRTENVFDKVSSHVLEDFARKRSGAVIKTVG